MSDGGLKKAMRKAILGALKGEDHRPRKDLRKSIMIQVRLPWQSPIHTH